MSIRLVNHRKLTSEADGATAPEPVDTPPAGQPDDDPDAQIAAEHDETPSPSSKERDHEAVEPRHAASWKRYVVFLALPIVALIATVAVGYARYQLVSLKEADSARLSSVQAARDATSAILSYRPDTVENDLSAAQSKLTGAFRDSYASLTKDVVIPGAKQKQVSAEASVPAGASVSATGSHAVVLVFVNQAVVVGSEAPSSTMSSVRVTLDKIDGRWLVSGFDPV